MKDKCDREIKHIRLSVTAECTYNCIYCDSEGFSPKKKLLTVNEITKLCRMLAEILNVTRIKLTGGEPLYRDEIIQIIQNINDLGLYDDISLTSNGYKLGKMAQELAEAGLDRINVSLCSLKPEIYKEITGVDGLNQVLEGLKAAKQADLTPIKINYVIMQGINNNEFEDMIDFCGKHDYILQLIELHKESEDLEKNNGKFYDKYHKDVGPIINDLESRSMGTLIRGNMQNRKVFVMQNGAIIETVVPSHKFCMGCTKLRVGCDGNIFGCLFRSDLGKNVKEELHNHCQLSKFRNIIQEVVDSREPYY
ncbi:MAG: GTP 3',8-cyclase MoaA [Promethearchaeia archaeon]